MDVKLIYHLQIVHDDDDDDESQPFFWMWKIGNFWRNFID
jgi:hypothetical protein